MTILNSKQKEQLLRQVQQYQNIHSISVEDIVKLIEKYDNLEVEDFAPPVLPPELFKCLQDYYFDSTEIEAWERLLREPYGNEEEVIRLVNETEEYISSYRNYQRSHVNEAYNLLDKLKSQLNNLQQEKVLKKKAEQRGWDRLNGIIRYNENNLHYSIQEIQKYLSCYPDSEHVPEARKLLDEFCSQMEEMHQSKLITYTENVIIPVNDETQKKKRQGNSESWFGRLFRKKLIYYNVFSSVFAPAEVKFRSHMQVQVYLHLYEETEKVSLLAVESDEHAERRDYIPLRCKLKKGDRVDVLLNIYGERLLMSDNKSVVWQGSFTKCSFDYFVPKDIDVEELSCVALLSVNGVPVGEMRFITKIIETPRQLNPEIIAHKYNKVFISYSHQDESKVKFLHEGLKIAGTEHFFDRDYLTIGDVFPQVIRDYINSADLFILCWSENASKSEYVQKERSQALERAFPQVRPEQAAKLRIYPMSIEPHAELPGDMKNYYHFGEI